MKVGDVVTYKEGGQEFNALVLGERHGTYSYRDADNKVKSADHAGTDGQPLLTLVFAKERKDAFGNPLPVHGTGQTSELVQTRLDVAHESHTYDDAQQSHFGKKSYDGGRWREKE